MAKNKAAPAADKKPAEKKVKTKRVSGIGSFNGGLQANANKAKKRKDIADKKAADVAKKAADAEQKRVDKKRKERDAAK